MSSGSGFDSQSIDELWEEAADAHAPAVELLLFEIGPAVYAADASQVRRIDRASAEGIVVPELGTPRTTGGRALVFATPEGERQLTVDRVLGVENARVDQLRRMPPVARGHSFALGMWLSVERPILLIDLPETARVSQP